MGRGRSGGGSGSRQKRRIVGGIPRVNVSSERDMLSESGIQNEPAYAGFLNASKRLVEDYGDNALAAQFMIAKLKGASDGVIAYYDSSNGHVAINERFLDDDLLESAYENCVKNGFHPSKGNKSASEAVAAHELGHAMTDAIAKKMGYENDFMPVHKAAQRIIDEARATKSGKTKISQDAWAGRISGYAQQNAAETVAEAVADVYCNRTKAHKESKAIMRVVNKYIKQKKSK